MSTTSGPLSSFFGTNRGADFTNVYTGALNVSVPGVGGLGGPNPFNFVISFQNSFLYDPSQGDLMWEWQNFGPLNTSTDLILDADNAGLGSGTKVGP